MRLFLFLLLTVNYLQSQSEIPISLRTQFNGAYGYKIIGNTNNEFDNWQQNPVPPCQMLTSTSALLNLQNNQNIVAAYLYWSGIGDGTYVSNVKLNNITYSSSNTSVGFIENNNFFSHFGSFIDVTQQIQNEGNTNYTLSNINLNPILDNYCSSAIYYLGWSVLVIYSEVGLPNVQLNVYDGFNVVSPFFNNGITNITINNLNIIDNSNSKMSYIIYNGSNNLYFDEYISLNGNILSNSLNPPNNPFNGTNSFTGSTTNWNQDIDTFDISSYVNIGDITANITLASGHPRFLQTLVTSIRSELSDATVQINQVTGQEVCGNRNLVVDYSVSNTNSNAILPANANVSLYADNTFLQTVVTPTPIAVGGSLNLQTTVNIPLSIPDNFTLKIIVDNNNANLSQIAESNEDNNEDSLTINLTPNTVIVPTFTQVNPICNGQILNQLPITSLNGITGNWSPSINNLATTTYTFIPNTGQCATTVTMTIVVNPNVIPNFTQVNSICNGQILNQLPTTSLNGITGNWSPSINNFATTIYTFTPNIGQCASTATMTIVVNPNVIPNFTDITICSNDTNFALNNQAPNGVSGTWLPSSINLLSSATYTFTPNSNQCSTAQSITVTIVPNENFDFDYTITNSLYDAATISITTNSDGNFLYQLDNGTVQNTSVFENVASGNHTLIVYDQNVCKNSITKNIQLIKFPKYFTPNNDGVNDVWNISESTYFKIISLKIIDRYGKLLKVITSNSSGWNGLYNDKMMPSDDYWFVLKYNENGIEKEFKSHFSLKR